MAKTHEHSTQGKVLLEVAVIVGSILLAFGIDALWDAAQERQEEALLLADLAAEYRVNRERLQVVTDRRRTRIVRMEALINEAGPERVGLSADSLAVLLDSVQTTPSFGVRNGVTTRALSGGDLSLIRDRDLRARLAAFWPGHEYFFDNQTLVVTEIKYTPDIILGTGTAVFPDIPDFLVDDAGPPWDDPLTVEQVATIKYYSVARYLDGVLARQGDRILAGIDSILVDIEAAR